MSFHAIAPSRFEATHRHWLQASACTRTLGWAQVCVPLTDGMLDELQRLPGAGLQHHPAVRYLLSQRLAKPVLDLRDVALVTAPGDAG